MIILLRNIFIILIIPLSVYAEDSAGSEFFKWMSKDGAVHFYERFPEGIISPADILLQNAGDSYSSPIENYTDTDSVELRFKNSIRAYIDATFSIKGRHDLGTGFFISHDGYAITCRHVLENDDSYVAVLNDGSEYPIGIISRHDKYDLALIIVLANKKTPHIQVGDPFAMAPGDRTFALGNSLGLQGTVTEGVFTGVREDITTKDNIVQFTAPINPGNSGGPLMNDKGKAIGVVSFEIVSQNGMPVTNVGFAIPSGYIISEYGYYLR